MTQYKVPIVVNAGLFASQLVMTDETKQLISLSLDSSYFGIDSSGLYIKNIGIDHDQLTNTHNLTTDIDHNQLTNTHQDVTTGASPTFANLTVATNVGEQFFSGIATANATYKNVFFNNGITDFTRLLLFNQVTALDKDVASPLVFKHTSTGDMRDGFGPGMLWAIQDTAGVENFIARIVAIRDGHDKSGKLQLQVYWQGTELISAISIPSSGYVGIWETVPETLLEMTSTVPYLTFHNSTHEDINEGRESRLIFKGEQSGGEETTLAQIEVSHDGVVDDEKGKIVFSTNDGNDGNIPTIAMIIDSAQHLFIPIIRSGATQVAAGATANELWKTSGHATLPDNMVMIGV